MELYEQIRKLHLEGTSQRQIAARLGVSRNTVKKYCEGAALPGERKPCIRTASVLTPEVKAFIQSCLEADKAEGTRKQRHTARRIYDRLVTEMGFTGSESTVRAYVHILRERTPEAFVPLAFDPGDAVQIDWGEAKVWMSGERVTVNLFCARLCYSDMPFVVAYRRQNSESFQEALIRAFEFFKGVSRRVIFDNAKVAVKCGFGANALAQDSYALLAAHYGFQPVFCNPSSGNEKGLVEGLVGFGRRNFLVPLPRVESMDELNALLAERCLQYANHTVKGKGADVGTLFREERERLYPLPVCRYDPAKRLSVMVDRFSTVRCDTNTYSVPVKYCGKEVSVRMLAERVEVYSEGSLIAVHTRCFERYKNIYALDHYLPLLDRKSRAALQAKPVRDNVPDRFLLWLEQRDVSPKELVALLERGVQIGFDAVMRGEVPLSDAPSPEIHDTVHVPPVDLSRYDSLLGKEAAV